MNVSGVSNLGPSSNHGPGRQPQQDSYGRKVPIWEAVQLHRNDDDKGSFQKQSSWKSWTWMSRKDSLESSKSTLNDKPDQNQSSPNKASRWKTWTRVVRRRPKSMIEDRYPSSPYTTLPADFSPGHQSHWKPFTLKLPALASIVLVTIGLIIALEILSQLSRGQNNEEGGGLAFAPTVDELSNVAIAAYLYLPTVVAVLYSMMWSWIDLDVKRLEPWFQLSKPRGAVAEESLLLQYPFDFLAFVPLRAARRRHWAVVIAGSTMVFITWAIVPLQSAIFSTGTVTRTSPASMIITEALMSTANQTSTLTSRFFNTAYGISWLEQKLPRFTTSEFALLPFRPELIVSNISSAETWSAETQMFYTNLTCKPGSAVGVGRADSFTREGVPINRTHFGDGEGCIIPDHQVGYYDSIGQMFQYIQASKSNPNCTGDENVHKFFAATSNTNSSVGLFGNLTLLFCQPTYHFRNVTATVNASTLAVVGVSYDKAQPPLVVTEEIFNITNFEFMLGAGVSSVQRRGNVSDTSVVSQTPKLFERNISWPASPMAGYAVALSNLEAAQYNDPVHLHISLEAAHKLLFATAVNHLLLPYDDAGKNIIASFQPRSNGVIRESLGGIVLVRAFAIVVEACLSMVGALTCTLWLYYRRRKSSMMSDPGSISDVMELVRSSRRLLHDFNDNGTITDKVLEERLKGHRFRLCTMNTGGVVKMQLLAESGVSHGDIDTAPIRTKTEIDCPDQFQAVRPVEMKYITGVLITVVVSGAIVTLTVLYIRILATDGLRRPTSNETVLLILTNLVPTAFATLLEPFWIVLNRLLCVLQPFDDLRSGNAASRSTIKARYTSVPPQLAFLRAVRSKHFLLAIVCAVAMSTNVLAVALSALFEESPTPVLVSAASKALFTPVLDGRPDFFDNVVDGTRVPVLDHYYAAIANLSEEASLPPWVDSQYWFMPFELPKDVALNATGSDPEVNGYSATTRGFGYDMDCWSIGAEPNDVNGDTLTFERYLAPPTLPERQAEWTFSVSHNLTDGRNITCGQYKFGNKNGTSIFMEDFFHAGASMEVATSMGLSNDTNGISWSGRVGGFRMPPPDDGYCASMFIAGWLRMAEATLYETLPATKTVERTVVASGESFEADEEPDESLVDQWFAANAEASATTTPTGTPSPVVERRAIVSTFMQCMPTLRSAIFDVAVDTDGRVTSANRTSDFETDMEVFGGEDLVRDLTVQVNQLVGVLTDGRFWFWHNDTVTADWFNSALALKTKSMALVDAAKQLPNITEITPAVVDVYGLVSAILLSQNSRSFKSNINATPLPLSIITTEQRIIMEPIMFYIAVALLGIQLLTLIAYYVYRPRRFLPRMPLTIASVIAFVSASHATQSADRLSCNREARYGYGRFRGVDGKTHVGIEIEPLVVPLKVENPEFKRRRRSLWLRKKQDPAQPKIWI